MELEEIKKRLKSLGYEYKEEDEYSLTFAMQKIEQHILSKTNCAEVPAGLNSIAIDMVCAEFLKLKKSLGLLTDKEFKQVANSIKMGDTQISFPADATPEQKFDAALAYMIDGHEDDFIRYRKMVW